MVGNFAFFNCAPVGRTSDSMMVRLKDLSIDEMVGALFFGCLSAHGGLLVGFLLLRYSVLFTVESLSLLYLLVIQSTLVNSTMHNSILSLIST